MAIPTFNDGDKLAAIRLNSLNPVVEKVNKLEAILDDFQKFDQGVVQGGTKSLTSLDSGWWFVPSSLAISSRPPGVLGDFIFYKQVVTGDAGSPRNGVIVAYGFSQVGNQTIPTIWTRYKVGSSWTPWASGNRALSDVLVQLADIKKDIPTISQIEQGLIDAGWVKNGGNTPSIPKVKILPTIRALFSTTIPTTLANMSSSINGEVTLRRSSSDLKRIMVVVDKGDSSRVGTISVNDGLGSNWLSRNVSISGKDYTVFYSSGAYSEQTAKVTVMFN